MRRSVYISSLAALLAGTATAGPSGTPPSRPARPPCCAEGIAPGAMAGASRPPVAATATAATVGAMHATGAPAPSPGRADASASADARIGGQPGADADAAEIDALIDTLYRTVSGPAGARRDWSRLARLHAPGARLHLTRADADGRLAVDTLDFDAFIALHETRFADRDFHEREIAREVAGFGGVRHVWSTFEARRHPDDPAPYARGVNSLQLVRTAEGWRLLSATWDFETPTHPLPRRIEAVAVEAMP